ncbi:hypothetical protein LZC95_15475 [Pendulispora brunnea]|uniref:Uncharacterized protein n=1 Tax=Pendulispora brunnea TaxID=2905690 RepID=A0ABZ2KMN9_9BACT
MTWKPCFSARSRCATFGVFIAFTYACSQELPDALGRENAANLSARVEDCTEHGLLASAPFSCTAMKSAFFFAGSWQNGIKYYEYSPVDNRHYYTVHPADSRHLNWSERRSYQDFALDELVSAGFNVIDMSTWGPRGSDNWAPYAPMQTSTYAQDELFDAALKRDILIIPVIEDVAATPNSPQVRFPEDFGRNDHLRKAIDDLVNRYIVSPANPKWPSKWAQIYDSKLQPRYAVLLMHVCSKAIAASDPDADSTFASWIHQLAEDVKGDTGVDVGFTLDATPADGASANTYYLVPKRAGAILKDTREVLAIRPFLSEILHMDGPDEDRFWAKHDEAKAWIATGIPYILDITAGYNATIFGEPYVYGNDDIWRNDQGAIRGLGQSGLSFTAWNGYTESWAGMPTQESGRDGTPGDTWNRWLKAMLSGDARRCNYVHFVNGQPSHRVYGEICEKWVAYSGTRGVLGSPRASEADSHSDGSRISEFQYGIILWNLEHGAHEVHGLIADKYRQLGLDGGDLGMPTADQESSSTCEGGAISRFERGTIDWCPGWTEAQGHPNNDAGVPPTGPDGGP